VDKNMDARVMALVRELGLQDLVKELL